MAKRGGAAAQLSDAEVSDGEESKTSETSVEALRRQLRQQDVVPWRGRRAEISACRESIERTSRWPAIAAITASGCCACNTLHVSMLASTPGSLRSHAQKHYIRMAREASRRSGNNTRIREFVGR